MKCNRNKLVAVNNGTAIVSVSKDDVTSFVSVAVGTKPFAFVQDFEKDTGSSLVYPSDTKGGYLHSTEFSYRGIASGKITYDFTVEEKQPEAESDEFVSLEETEETPDVSKAVYYVLEDGVIIDESCDKISIRMYCETPFNHELRAQFEDADGKMKIIRFEGEIKEGRWNELFAYIPKDSNKPLTLKRVYVLYTPGEEKDKGYVYIDEISLVSFVPQDVLKAPENIYRKTQLNADVKNTLRIGAVSQNPKNNPVITSTNASLESYVNKADAVMILGNGSKYVTFTDENALYIRLDTSKGGIRNTDSTQWAKMTQAIENSDREYVFVLSDNSLFGDDDFENQVVKDYFASVDKKVFVVTCAESAAYKNIDGVEYVVLDSTPESNLSPGRKHSCSVVEFSFGETVTFEFKEI